MDEQNKNLILATALSFLVILVWSLFFMPAEVAPTGETAALSEGIAPAAAPGTDAQSPALVPTAARADVLARSPRVPIRTASLTGSIALEGARLDDILLSSYGETLDPGSSRVTLLSPHGASGAYYALGGWSAPAGFPPEQLPSFTTLWTLEAGSELTEASPVTLAWNNGAGLTFRRTFAIDENYMLTIEDSVENALALPVSLQPYGIIARQGKPQIAGIYLLHEGIVRAADGTIEEIDYDEVSEFPLVEAEGTPASIVEVQDNGWTGFTDKYWMTTLIAPAGQKFTSVAKYNAASDTWQTDLRLPVLAVAPGATASATTRLFAGAKEVSTIRAYQNELKIGQFVDSVDWGWFFFLTKPIFSLLDFLHGLIGNMGWAIIGLTFVIKTLLFPLTYKSAVAMSRLKKLQPEMEKIKERAGDDRVKLQQEMMALYRTEKVNPASGCLPILLQIPIFFALYKVLFVTLEMRHEPFIGWIHDLSAPDPTSLLNLFGLLPWAAPAPGSILAVFSIGVFPILMGITMWMQQKLNPAPTDRTQAVIFAWMPWVFMFMLGSFASGLVIYWVANNTISFVQQYLIMRSQGVKPDLLGNIFGGLRKSPGGA
jgi:YidC/Oxa1 family membrane protein insertase